jgi:Na+-translocating ferredoxin:NAD+ oxidoreductase RnfD subunit
MLKKFFGGTDNNIMNPYLIGDAVMQSKRRYINKKPIRRK